jgi:ribosomal 30S subunit maturation factor RimM
MKGIVTDVREVPQGQLLVVDVDGKDVLIPFRKEFIQFVDKQKGEITIIQWEGLS